MKGTVQKKKMRSGKEYFTICLTYQDPYTNKRKQKVVSTGLEVKGNKRKAQNMIPSLIEKYEYLERYLPTTLEHDISLCDYLDEWLKSKRISIRTSTYESIHIE